ncbi:hypothetical protein SDJN02_00611, partial [Cucurbita argyrosperma subsp. argyrosperma]
MGLLLQNLGGIHCYQERILGLIRRSSALILPSSLIFCHGDPWLKFWSLIGRVRREATGAENSAENSRKAAGGSCCSSGVADMRIKVGSGEGRTENGDKQTATTPQAMLDQKIIRLIQTDQFW